MEIGIKQSVIQNKDGRRLEYINMAWWFQSLRATGLYIVAFIITPWLCEFYFHNKPDVLIRYSMRELILLVRIAFLSIFFNGFISPRAHILEKDFKFIKAVIITQGGFAIGTIITIILAFALRNVWSIVIGFTIIGLSRCVLSYILCPFIPELSFDKESFQELCHFAAGMLGLPILTYIAYHLHVLVAGKLISASLVGFYGMALALAIVPRFLFTRIINPVLLPAFAEKQDDRKFLCKVTLKVTKVTALFVIPPTALAVICSKSILTFVYGQEYSTVAIPFGLLCVYVVFLIMGNILACVFFGIGQPGKHRAFVGLRVVILAVLIYPGIKLFGLTGAAAVVVFASFAAMCVQVTVVRKTIGLNNFDYAKSWLPGLVSAIPVIAIVILLGVFRPERTMVQLIFGILSSLTASLAGLLLVQFFAKLSCRTVEAGGITKHLSHEKVKSA